MYKSILEAMRTFLSTADEIVRETLTMLATVKRPCNIFLLCLSSFQLLLLTFYYILFPI